MRLWIAATTGFDATRPSRRFAGHYRPFFDVTNEPAPTLMIRDRGERIVVEDDGRPWPPLDARKPPYRVPSMSEVREIPATPYRVVSVFTGAGGSCLGFRMAGLTCVYAIEFVEAARETYRANFPHVHLDPRDVREITPEQILERTGLARGELDVLEGSPPCSSFSTAGKRERGWGRVNPYSDTTQRVDDLFAEYVRLLRGLMPRTFVAENVSGLIKGKAKGYFKEILSDMRASGYRVRAQVLDAQWLGVPQMRARLIFAGVRDDLDVEPAFPRPLPYRYTMREALQGAGIEGEAVLSTFGGRRSLDEPVPTVLTHGRLHTRNELAIATHNGMRRFTIDELRRVCSFPDDYVLTGSYAQQWERLGRAVPPLMARAIATTLRDEVLVPLDQRAAA